MLFVVSVILVITFNVGITALAVEATMDQAHKRLLPPISLTY